MRRVMTGLAAAVALAAGAATGPVAKVARVNGGPTVTVNGEVIPPMTMTAGDFAFSSSARRAISESGARRV